MCRPLTPGPIRSLPQKAWIVCRSYGVVRGNRTAPLAPLPAEPAAAGDLISFHKALPDCRMHRGVRFPQCWMHLVVILAILSNEGSLVGIERFARRHRKVLNELMGTDFGKEPSDSTFRLLLSPLDVAGFETLLRQWMSAQSGVAEGLDTLVCDGKTLRGSIAETVSGAAKFIAKAASIPRDWASRLPRPLTPPQPAAKPRSRVSCWTRLNSKACWCRRTRCIQTARFLFLAQRGADFLIAVKH